MYFSTMPNIYYDFIDKNGNPYLKVLKDITSNVRIIKDTLDNVTVYDYYDILDNETMEIISTKVYGTPNYHWMLMLLNDIYDYRSDMPMSFDQLDQWILQKYDATYSYISSDWNYVSTNTSHGIVTTATITIPNHTVPVGATIVIENAVAPFNPPNGQYIVTATTIDTISFVTPVPIGGQPSGTLKIFVTVNQTTIHHWVDPKTGFIVNQTYPGAVSVTNYDYEVSVNESKRRIKLVSKQVLDAIAKQYTTLFS